jgi:outer membrane protein OmpA-like peptidoglycan-associated protein
MKLVLLSGVFLAASCATAGVPGELTMARQTYERAQQGPAATLAPAELHKARLALDEAERSFANQPGAGATRDLAYVATRKSELAETQAAIEGSRRAEQQANRSLAALEAYRRAKTEAELSEARGRLAAVERQAEATRLSLTIKEEERGTVIALPGEVLFASGQWSLLPGAQRSLDRVAEALAARGSDRVLIEGHTDARGSASFNQDLSYRRAQAVRDYLVGRGVAAERVRVIGLGKSNPVADNATPEGRANNRRVEIVIERQTAGIKRPAE